jgi:sugar transferase EpsL
MKRATLKRGLDLVLVVPGIVVLSPLLVVLGLLVRLTIGPPVLFRQLRSGFRGTPFTILKLRTMTGARDPEGNLLSDDDRLTRLGRFLRRTSLDELPEMFKVLKGDMSLVGPRPLRIDYLPLYSPEQMRRHEMKPGITGWSQVNGRNALTWEEKFALDVWYIDHWSLWLDFRILGASLWKVMVGEGVSAEGQATMTEFTGTRSEDDAGLNPGVTSEDAVNP